MVATLRDNVSQTGVIPHGLEFLQDDQVFVLMDMKKARLTGHPILENAGIKEVPVMRCTGVFQKAEEKNANGRIYPATVLEDAIKKLKRPISERRVMGEFDHPPDAKIHLDRVSHLVSKLWMEGKKVIGELEVINDDRCAYGSMLACYLDRAIQIGVSSRGVGDMELVVVEGEDAYKVQDGYELITFDAVAEPSVSGTQLKQMMESLEKKTHKKQLKEAREKLLAREIGRYLLG